MSDLETLLKLIPEAGTLRQLQDFLRLRGLPHSGSSWEMMIEERIRPALKGRRIQVADLIQFLREVEEFGHQHVFLFRWKSGNRSLPDDKALRAWLTEANAAEVFESPRILEYPDQPTITEARRDWAGRNQSITVKVIETRVHTIFIEEEERANNRFVRVYEREMVRAVNVARIHADGILEFRIYSHRSGEREYKDDVDALWLMLTGIIDPKRYDTLSIVRAKQELWEKRAELHERIRFSDSSLLNDNGTRMSCRTGSAQKNLFDDKSADEGLSKFKEGSDAYFDSHNVWWIKQKKGAPSQDVHVLLSGEANEFAVTRHCSQKDYEHVLADIRRLNR